jgi:tetratricopeptide (TPR) repeat protein
MDLLQLEESFESLRLSNDRATMVEKAVELANAYQQIRKFGTANACLKKILPDVENDSSLHATVLTAMGTVYWEKAQLQKALDQFEEALNLFKSIGDPIGKGAILSITGITFWRKCDWGRAIDILADALCQNKDRVKENRFRSLYGAFDRGIITLQNRVRLGRELQDSFKILQPLFSMCALQWVIGNHEQLAICLDESESLARSLNKTDIFQAAKDLRGVANLI